jgi:LCP family protein required for cell wall assembly
VTARGLASCLLGVVLAGCASFPKEAIAGFRPAKGPGAPPPISTANPTVAVTPAILLPPPVYTAEVRSWPSPGTYGSPGEAATPVPPAASPLSLPTDAVNILLIGSDVGTIDSSRTDVLIIASLRPETSEVSLITVPRDLYVYLPGYTMQRVNTAWIYGEKYHYPGGGFGMLRDTILYNLGISIDYYVRVDMTGFRKEINELGGIDVLVSCAYTDWRLRSPSADPQDEENWVLFTVPSGRVHMNGDYALWYARSRARSSDFDRARRQHEVLRAIYRQALRLDLIPRIPQLYDGLSRALSTDMTLGDMISLAPMATHLDPAHIRSRFIGRDQVISWRVPTSGAAVLLPKPEEIQRLLVDAFTTPAVDPIIPRPPDISVQIVNHSRHPDWDLLAAERLNYAGFQTEIADDDPQSGSVTQVIELSTAEDSSGARLLASLGLSPAQMVTQPDLLSPFQFRLVVGDNYRPCFNPTQGQS